jgi:hypothetical protein
MSSETLEQSSSEVDPSIKAGGKILFDREIPLQVQRQGERSAPIPTHIRVVVGSKESETEPVRVELTTDSDLYLLYEAEFNQDAYAELQSKQGLDVGFSEVAAAVVELVNLVMTEGQGYEVLFDVNEELRGKLVFTQKLKFKSVEIMSIDLNPASDESVKQQIQYRFNSLKSQLKLSKEELTNLYGMLKIKDPSALKPVRSPRK